jgi:hypothetical protein
MAAVPTYSGGIEEGFGISEVVCWCVTERTNCGVHLL